MRFSGRVLLHDDVVCIADLHIGVEQQMEEEGYAIPSQTKRMFNEISSHEGNILIILGDVKHSVPGVSKQELREIPVFLRMLRQRFGRVVVCKGNHDGRIERLTDIEVVKDFVYNDVGFTHGHRWPGKDVFNSSTIVMGHVHPAFVYRNHLGRMQREQCWLTGRMKKTKLKREKGILSKTKSVVVMPAFNRMFYGRSKHEFGVLTNFVEKDGVFLTDSTKVF
jgi:putative SbcD/Mre11-related phosphoesterase